MRVAITGAGGFIGTRVVRAALAGGHEVVALVRDASRFEVEETERALHVHAADLEQQGGLEAALQGCDCVVHLAAAMGGADLAERTLAMTRQVLAATEQAGVKRLVLLSSISVLDYASVPAGTAIDERVPTNDRDAELGPYACAKRDQERLADAWQAGGSGRSLCVLRAGLVYDASTLAAAHAGFSVRELGLTVTHGGQVPVVHVDNVASAAALAIEAAHDGGSRSVVLVDDSLPSQASYLKALASQGALAGWSLPVPWRLFGAMAAPLRVALSVLGQSRRVPDTFRRNSMAARFQPLTFDNGAAKRLLGWQPATTFRSTFPIS